MLLLPKITYYFRALPIPLPSSFFITMQKQLSKFVCAGSRARFPPIMQRKHKAVGGIGLPVLKEYYMAAILDQLRGWFDQTITKPWCQLEHAWLSPNSPLYLLIAHNMPHINIPIDHPTIQASMNSWTYLKEVTHPTLPSTNIPIPLDTLHWLIPNISLTHWLRKDIHYLRDLMKNDKLM